MEGMSDEYEFKIAEKANKHLITAIRQAFDKDEQAAYSVSTGSHGGAENYISLAVGNGNKGVGIGEMKDSKWIYACFLDPEDTLRLRNGVGGEEGWFNHRAHHQDLCYYAEVQTEKDEYQSYD